MLTRPTYWIGLVYDNTSSAFTRWRHDQPASFTRWAKYEPKYENGDCVTFRFDGYDFTWSVSNCTSLAGYICKSELVSSRTFWRVSFSCRGVE